MRVLFFTQIYPSRQDPHRGPYNHHIFSAVSKRCEARVITPVPWWVRTRRFREMFSVPHENQTGIETALPTYWSIPGRPAVHARGMYLSLRGQVKRLRREFPFDAILAAWAYPDAATAAMLARDFSCPLVVKILGSDVNELTRYPALRDQIRRGLAQAYRVVTVSGALKERVVELGIAPERVVVQHNGVNGDRFFVRDRNTARAQLQIPPERPTICYVGRLGHEKGVDVLMEAMGHLKSSGRQDVLLTMVGGGDMEEALRRQAQALQVEEQVRFCGMRPHDEVPLWVSACDVLCLASRREGCPNVILESLASGRPVVATNVGGVPELLSTENGILVPSEDPKALAQGLAAALERRWEPEALRDSVQYLSWDAVGGRYYDVLVEAMEDRRRVSQTATAGSAAKAVKF